MNFLEPPAYACASCRVTFLLRCAHSNLVAIKGAHKKGRERKVQFPCALENGRRYINITTHLILPLTFLNIVYLFSSSFLFFLCSFPSFTLYLFFPLNSAVTCHICLIITILGVVGPFCWQQEDQGCWGSSCCWLLWPRLRHKWSILLMVQISLFSFPHL